MKKIVRTFLLALPFLIHASPARADGPLFCTCDFYRRLCDKFHAAYCEAYPVAGHGPSVGPWYTYWPYDAHFQTPAHPSFPYWPAPMTSPIQPGHGPHPGYYGQPVYRQPAGYPTIGTYAYPPNYWQGP